MKRFFSLIMACMMLLLFPISSLADQTINVKIDDQIVEVKTNVNLQLNGQNAYSEYQPFIYKNRTYVPIRFIAEYFHADVEWVRETKDVIITKDGNQLKITINSKDAMKNGQSMTLADDSIPKLVTYPAEVGKTVVPLRAVSELLGYQVDWDETTRTAMINDQAGQKVAEQEVIVESSQTQIIDNAHKITGVRQIVHEGREAYLIEGAAGADYEHFTLTDPDRYVIDILNADTYSGKNTDTLNIPIGAIDQVRINDRYIDGLDTANVRVVLDGTLNGNLDIVDSPDGLILIPPAKPEGQEPAISQENIQALPENQTQTSKRSGQPKSRSEITIVIDAGHGGQDPGALSAEGDREKDINLKASKRVAQLLREQGYNVVETRDADYFIAVRDRAIKANQVNADVFLSIHANSATTRTAKGIETFYAPRDLVKIKTEAQYPFAKAVHDGLLEATGMYDRGVKSGPRLIVLNSTKMPAALVELGFMSNPSDLDKLQSDAYLEQCAQGLTNGINKYLVDKYDL